MVQLRLILFAVIVACLGVIALAKCPHHHHHHHHHHHGHDHNHQDEDDHHHHQHEEEEAHHHHHHHHEDHAEHHDGSDRNNMSTLVEKCMAAALGSIATSILPIVCIPLLSMLTQLLASSLAAFGSRLNLKKEQMEAFLLRWFVLLAVGAILSDLVTHMLPELGQDASHNAAELLFAAFAGSYVLERFAQWALLDDAPASSTAHGHSHNGADRGGRKHRGCAGGKDHPHSKKDEKETAAEATKGAVAWVCLVTDTIHNAMDGLGIGVVTLQVAAKLTVPGLAGVWGGLSPTILAIVIHELSHEIADFAVLRSAGWSTTAIIKSQLMTAMSNFVVAVGTVVVGGSHPWLQATMEPVVAGAFLYLAFVLLREATNVPPSSVHELGADVLALGLGFAMVVACHVH